MTKKELELRYTIQQYLHFKRDFKRWHTIALKRKESIREKDRCIQTLRDAVAALGGLKELEKRCPELAHDLKIKNTANIPDQTRPASSGAGGSAGG